MGDTIVEPRSVARTEMRPEERVDVVPVPHTVESVRHVPRTVMDTVHEHRQVPRTEMVPKCVQDRYEETRLLRFDPQTGAQIGQGPAGLRPSPLLSAGSPHQLGGLDARLASIRARYG